MKYVEHTSLEVQDFRVCDTTQDDRFTGEPLDLIWVGIYGEGRWMTAAEAEELAGAIFGVATTHRARRAPTQRREVGPWMTVSLLRKPGEPKARIAVRRLVWRGRELFSEYMPDSFATLEEAHAAIERSNGVAA